MLSLCRISAGSISCPFVETVVFMLSKITSYAAKVNTKSTALPAVMTPAYDLVPAPVASLERRDLAMTIERYGRAASIYNLLSQCERFGLSAEAARAEIEKIVTTLRAWRDHFHACGVSAKDIEYIAPAFLPESFFFEKPLVDRSSRQPSQT